MWAHRRVRIALICALASLPLLAGGYTLLRHSSFVSVQRVHVTGVHGPEAQAIDAALIAAARRMSTLDVRTGALMASVAPFRVVSGVKIQPQIPHGLKIVVREQLPVAALQVGSVRTAVAANGVVLGPALLSSTLPTVGGYRLLMPGEHVRDGGLLGYLAVLGAAPGPLARLIARVYVGPEGLTVAMRSGLLAYFGDATRPHAKWLSLIRVLADHSSTGASYVDVRLPARPAAGFSSGSTQAMGATSATTGTTTQQQANAESESATVAALAASLTSGGAAASAATPSEPSSTSTSESSTPHSEASESKSPSASGESAESHSSTGSEASPTITTPGG
jgi:cell division septal protein FtsQ